ncbi:MAG: c-type cytochrome, partial [Acidobacteria bacterium]|nr:c-type cytochrome [Acidobacteriota bacterium]
MKERNERGKVVFSLTRMTKLTSTLGLGALMLFVATDGRVGQLSVANAAVADEWKIPPDAKKTKNPVAASPDSISKGKLVYDKNCAGCHGATGGGDGKVGLALKPKPPAKWTKQLLAPYSDGELFAMISIGKK